MRIPNKFNGYSRDGIRLYNDPVTLTALTAAGAEGSMIAAPALAAGATEVAAGAALPGIVGGMGALAPEVAGVATGALPGIVGGAGAMAPEVTAAQGIMNGAVPADVAAGLQQSALPVEQVSAANPSVAPEASAYPSAPTTTTPPTAPSGYPTTVQTPFGEQPIPEAPSPWSGAPNAPTPSVTPPASPDGANGIMDAAKTGYDALKSGFKTAMDFAQKNPLLTSVGINAAQRLFQEEPKKEKYTRKNMSGFSASEPSAAVYTPMYKPTAYAVGGPVEQMSAINSISGNTMYPQSQLQTAMYSNPMMQRPVAANVVNQGVDTNVDSYTGEEKFAGGGNPYLEQLKKEEKQRKEQAESVYESMQSKGAAAARTTRERSRTQLISTPYEAAVKELQAMGKKYKIPVAAPAKTSVDVMGDPESDVNAANGGIMHGLGDYSDGGRLLRGPGDGVSDSIPATIGHRQPARLADGEFVIPARIVSELGNGSTEAGARQLYAMMERIQKNRSKSIGKGKVAVDSKSKKHLPA
jgi:hypothetical protein